MYKFLFQINDENQLLFDFQYQLLNVFKVNYFLYEETYQYDFICIEDIDTIKLFDNIIYIPVGSMDFVDKVILHTEKLTSFNSIPIYIPESLQKEKYLKRNLFYETKKENKLNDVYFIKSLESYKDFTDINDRYNFDKEKKIVLSSLIEIESEYRCFIYDGILISCRNYMGDEFILPDKNIIKNMINDYKDSPKAYTLDVGVLNTNETVVLEVHPFVSCGLYGADLNKFMIPMIINGYFYYKNNKI